MAKQDDWARITLRIPTELHQRLTSAAGVKSLNAEIVSRLEESLDRDEMAAGLDALSPPDSIPETDFDRDVAAAIGKAVRSVMRSHGMNPVSSEDLAKDDE